MQKPGFGDHTFHLETGMEEVKKLLPLIEKELSPFNARPHWGKLFTIPASTLESRYEKLSDFKKLAATYDPAGKFRNDFLNGTIYQA